PGRAPDLPRLGSADDSRGAPGAGANRRAAACDFKRKALAGRCAQHLPAVSRVLGLPGRMDGFAERAEPTLSFAVSRPELGNHKLALAKARVIIRVAPRNAARPQSSRGSLRDPPIAQSGSYTSSSVKWHLTVGDEGVKMRNAASMRRRSGETGGLVLDN